ncbi:MAG: winged helix-turn-helix domain-containing protein [Ardenticatenia bacterium]|nr:winged helix-turn-helix domain-containing protein [Ardenticatenia bacterium]
MAAELHLRFPKNNQTFEVRQGRDVVAGLSASCDLCLGDYLTGARVRIISRRHFRILYVKPDGFAIEDLDSLNGTLVNGQPLRAGEWRFLRHGDVITPAGSAEFDIEVQLDEDDITEIVARTSLRREASATTGLRHLAEVDQFVLDGRSVPHTHLTPLEHALLRHLVQNAGRVCTYDDLVEHVWGYKHYDETQNNTVAKTVSNLRKKLNDFSPGAGTRHIRTVHGRGVECVTDV